MSWDPSETEVDCSPTKFKHIGKFLSKKSDEWQFSKLGFSTVNSTDESLISKRPKVKNNEMQQVD